MTDLYLLDPGPAPVWSPFQDTRPVSELRAGAWLIRERWEAIAGGETRAIFCPPPLLGFVEDDVPPVAAPAVVDGPVLVGRSTFVPSGVSPELGKEPATLVNDGAVVGWYLPGGHRWAPEALPEDGTPVEVEGMTVHGAYDLVEALDHFLMADVADFAHEKGDPIPDGCIVLGDPHEVVVLGGTVEPGVTFDVRRGSIVIEQHAYVAGGTRLEGPVYVGPGTQVLGGPIAFSAFGPRCRVRGEIGHTVFLGYANKAHDGFVGHSVVGRWANLGAGTTTSNLKNTYGPIRIEVAGDRVETGRQFLGTLFGDHAKTAIGTMLGTGTILGVGANVFGDRRPPKHVPPFAWGLEGRVMERDGFLRIAERVLPRRNVPVTDAVRGWLGAIHDRART